MLNRRRAAGTVTLSVLAACVLQPGAAYGQAATDTNIGRYRFVTGSSYEGEAVPQFATDGKVGPENSWETGTRGRHRLNMFFDRETEIGSIHLYSGGDRDGPVDSFSVQYRPIGGSLTDIPGAEVTGNTDAFVELVFGAPVTTTQLQIFIDDFTATIQEVALFPPGASPAAQGTGVNVHLARQHRLPLTTASSTAGGSSRRAIVDGFVNDTGYWQSGGGANEWIALDMTDPPETDPPSIRTETTPIEVGSVHLYTGLDSGAAPVERGRMQMLDDTTGAWVDIPGGGFANNTQRELSIVFDSPVTTAGLRLVIQSGGTIVREIVPLPDNDGQGWPIGTSVIFGEETSYLTYGDAFHGISLDGSGLSMTSALGADVAMRPANTLLTQHYQLLLNVGTDTYRIRSRATGRCLEPAGGSSVAGAAVIEADYIGLPTQHWRMESVPGGVRLVNRATGLAVAADSGDTDANLIQQTPGGANETWVFDERAHAPKKGNGGFPDKAVEFGTTWAYNWGPDDTYPEQVDFWPMQWGSFNWSQRPSLVPEWKRNAEPIVLMGYNEPDREDQADMPVDSAAAMWPRLEVMDMPLLGPAVAGHPATSPWIQSFMAQADSTELRLEFVGMHSYGGPNANSFINNITDAHNAWDRDVVVSEFSVVDWNNGNGWDDDAVWNFFAEVLWRMEKLPYLSRYAVFVFTDEPANPISDNRGEMLNADGTLTPEGKLFSAWDEDTQLRTDTPYHLHNEDSHARIGNAPGVQGDGSAVMGDRHDDGQAFRWRPVPASTPGQHMLESVADGRVLSYTSRGLETQDVGSTDGIFEFEFVEIEHGWFAIQEPGLGRRLRSNAGQGGAVTLAPAGTTSDDVRWRFAPVFGGLPGPPRGGAAVDNGGGAVLLTWAPHGFRDLIGITVYRQGPGDPEPVAIAAGVAGESWLDQVPAPGTYTYSLSAVGDTGESALAGIGAVSVETCPADFNADFTVDATDVEAAIQAIGGGLDYDGSGSADFFDLLAFLEVYDAGCPGD